VRCDTNVLAFGNGQAGRMTRNPSIAFGIIARRSEGPSKQQMWNDNPEEQIGMPFQSEADKPKLITIHTFTNETEAHLAKGALDAFGIDCMVARDDCGGQRPHMALTGGLRLLVRAEDARRAAEVLEAKPNETVQD
jgi:hypothetical protein